ncbi:hypothetical protein ANCDUO_11042 [Ancylostoma duodenale]|uniref:Uncharacterized protein n=1 Tax=Ancylostoma duodenale TaxID=51022 RepID=A0A0C2GCE9_9BILA|nr:hypothetical protein ANCDUO_11042 [Ancylostoma duodenale]
MDRQGTEQWLLPDVPEAWSKSYLLSFVSLIYLLLVMKVLIQESEPQIPSSAVHPFFTSPNNGAIIDIAVPEEQRLYGRDNRGTLENRPPSLGYRPPPPPVRRDVGVSPRCQFGEVVSHLKYILAS